MKRGAPTRTQRALGNRLGFKKRTQLVVGRGWRAGFMVAEQIPLRNGFEAGFYI